MNWLLYLALFSAGAQLPSVGVFCIAFYLLLSE